MSKRKIISIDQELCNGCGNCVPNCPEGAIQIIDGKARLISDIFCDGLGACIGECPLGAITIVEREAEEYNEKKVMKNIIKQGENTIKAHLQHLLDHNELEYYKEAIEVLKENNIEIPKLTKENLVHGCPGAKIIDFSDKNKTQEDETGTRHSQLKQWPIQLHLISPLAPYYRNKDVFLIADCVAYAFADIHKEYMKNRSIAIGCPKLDSDLEIYVEKVKAMIDESKINTLTVMTMEVPCCSGLLAIAQKALQKANRKIPLKSIVVSIQGDILEEIWV